VHLAVGQGFLLDATHHMPIVYLEPSDLSALQAQQVLDFLNRATSAEQLGRDIEFPDEPDIGVRLGQRLLDAREALGGAYTDIAQVRAVRLIGPERFTEICVGALGLDVRRWVELFYGGAPLALQAESGLAVSIDVLPQPAWLGQPLAVTVRVRDQGGSVRAGVPVTVQSGVGRLVLGSRDGVFRCACASGCNFHRAGGFLRSRCCRTGCC
jgi:hypothetical protein